MATLYHQDLAFIQAVGFGDFGRGAAPEIVRCFAGRRFRSAEWLKLVVARPGLHFITL